MNELPSFEREPYLTELETSVLRTGEDGGRPVFARVKTLSGGERNPWHTHAWAQLTYAIKGVLLVRTDLGTFLAPPHWAVWIPAGVAHEVIASVRTERRNFLIDPRKTNWDRDWLRVLEVTPLMRELIRAVAVLPAEYGEEGPDGRLVQVFLDQLTGLNESQTISGQCAL